MVYVVEDDPLARASTAALVASMGLAARTFGSAEEFFDVYVTGSATCIVSDLRLPGVSGMQICRTLKQRGDTTPVVIVTAYVGDAEIRDAEASHPFAMLSKPCPESELADSIALAIGQHE